MPQCAPRPRVRLLATLLPVAVLLTACSENDPVAFTEPVDPAGVWRVGIVVTVATGACDGEVGESSVEDITITKTGSAPPYNVTASGFLGDPANVLTGTFDANNRLLLSGSYPEDGGTTTAEHDLIAVSPDRMEGVENWTWSGTEGTCPGSQSSVTADRNP